MHTSHLPGWKGSKPARAVLARGSLLLLALLLASLTLRAQSQVAPAASDLSTPAPGLTNPANGATPEEQKAAIELELTNAYQRVIQIVNQPVQAYARPKKGVVANYNDGWFHPGAAKPDFDRVDIRTTQELNYAQHKYVTSSLNPGLVFLGQDLEYNPNTKYFYTNRSLPKHRLTEAEMLEINNLYRVIGRCEHALMRLRPLPTTADVEPAAAEATVETPVPGQSFERLRAIPRATRLLYGGVAIGCLVLVVVLLRLVRKTH